MLKRTSETYKLPAECVRCDGNGMDVHLNGYAYYCECVYGQRLVQQLMYLTPEPLIAWANE